MKKEEFLRDLRIRLSDLPYADQRRSLDYYSEMIDDRMEDGLSEEAAVQRIGTPAMAAAHIMQDMPLVSLARARMEKKRSGLATALIIIGSPIWISLFAVFFALAISAFAVLISLAAVTISVLIALWATEASLAACSVAGILISPLALFFGDTVYALLMLGAGLILAALTVFFYFVALYGSKALLFLCAGLMKGFAVIIRWTKSALIGKETIR